MVEYIERESAIYALRRRLGPNTSTAQRNMLQIAAIEIRGIKAANVAPVVHGRWEKDGVCSAEYICSECGGASWYYDQSCHITKSRFCPNCGARMDKEESKC